MQDTDKTARSKGNRETAGGTFSDDQGLQFSQEVLNCLHFHFSVRAAIIHAAGIFHVFRLQIAILGTDVSDRNKVLSSTSTLCSP